MPFANVIFDNTVFNIAAQIASCDLIGLSGALLFQQILVPQQILSEMQQFPIQYDLKAGLKMQNYSNAIINNYQNLQLCTSLDIITFSLLKELAYIDVGEAEAIAQAQKRQVYAFFTDDELFINNLPASYQHIRCYPTLFLIILLDINNFLPDYKQTLIEFFSYKPLPQNKGKTYFRNLYTKGLQYYGLPLDKKKIADKTSFKQLGIDI